jgi:hypothetical protein
LIHPQVKGVQPWNQSLLYIFREAQANKASFDRAIKESNKRSDINAQANEASFDRAIEDSDKRSDINAQANKASCDRPIEESNN